MTLLNSEHDYGIAWELDSQASVTVRIFRDFLEKTGPFLDNEWNRADNRESWFHVAQNLLNTMDENDFKEYIKLLENINSFIEATNFTWANNASPEKGCQKKDYVPDGRRRPFTRQLANETFFHFLKFSQNAEDLSKLRRSRCWNKSFKFYDSTLWHRDLSIFLKGKFYIDYGVKWAAKDFEKPREIHSFLYNCTERYDKINELDYHYSNGPSDDPSPLEKGLEFEVLCKKILEDSGWRCDFTPVSGDHGIDIVAKRGPLIFVLQCKNYETAVGVEAVQQIIAGREKLSAHVGAVVSKSGYTDDAATLAEPTRIMLLDLIDLRKM